MTFTVVLLSIVFAFVWSLLTPLPKSKKANVTAAIDRVGTNTLFESKLRFPDGPAPLPIFGNILEFWYLHWHRRPEGPLLELARKYGKMCTLWLGTDQVLVINSPKVAKDLLDKRGGIYSSRSDHRNWYDSWRLLLLPTGDLFRRMRKLYQTLLSPQQALRIRRYQDFESKTMLVNLLNNPANVLQESERYAISVLFSAVYGVRVAQANHAMAQKFFQVWRVMLNHLLPGTILIDFIPVLYRIPRWMQPWRLLMESIGHKRDMKLQMVLLRTVKRRMQSGNAPDCFAGHLIEKEEQITDDHACDILSMLVGAGTDTTAIFLEHFIRAIALHPEVASRAQEELDRVVGYSRLPTWEDENSLPYIRALIKETHRWTTLAGFGVWHATAKADEYDNYHIPSGTVILPNIPALSRDPELYPNPDVFNPDRFLHHALDAWTSAVHPDYKQRPHYSYGFGRRVCPGMHVAEASLFIVVSRLLWAFDIQQLPGAKPFTMDLRVGSLSRRPEAYKVAIVSRGVGYTAVMRCEANALHTDLLDFDDIEQWSSS